MGPRRSAPLVSPSIAVPWIATAELSRTLMTLALMDEQPRLVSVNFRLAARHLGLDVGVRLRRLGDRWLAVADFEGEPEVGIGATARTALSAALSSLGPRAATALLADPTLLGVSADLRGIA
jgi:hypothetical protein